ncbi:general substrate transporter [Xylariales sp. PMI_506]|nr:general substrate transporter [Xylariales sp. PMI_506]
MSYRLLFAIQWVFPGLVLLAAIIIPESPWFLVKHGKNDQAAKSLRRLHNSTFDVTTAISELEISIEREREAAMAQKNTSYIECFRGTNWRRTRIACGMFIIQQFTGIALYSQALYFLGIAGLDIDLNFKLALAGFGLGLFGNVASWFIMSYVGRRPLLIFGIISNLLLLLAIGIAGCFSSSNGALLFIGIMMNIVQLFYAPSVGAVSWSISAEISSAQLRAKTQALCTITNAVVSWLFNFITPYLINTDEANLGAKAGFIWAGLSLFGLVWVWFELPETKDRTFAEIDELFVRKTPTREFKTTVIQAAEQKTIG